MRIAKKHETDSGFFTAPEIHAMNPKISVELIRHRINSGCKSLKELTSAKIYKTGDKCKEINELVSRGWTKQMIADKAGCNKTTIINWSLKGLPDPITPAAILLIKLLDKDFIKKPKAIKKCNYCDNDRLARGMCNMHYRRWIRTSKNG